MRCPFCGANDDRVVDSRDVRGGGDGPAPAGVPELRPQVHFLRTDREHRLPGRQVGRPPPGVRPAEASRRPPQGLRKSAPVGLPALEEIVDEAEALLHRKEDREISTSELGNFVIDRLKTLDQVAYVRFASVYRKFEDVDEFMEELRGTPRSVAEGLEPGIRRPSPERFRGW